MNRFVFLLLCFVASLVTFPQANAQRLPEWELGLALGYAKVPFYRGSASGRDILLPLPLAIYRGKKYSVDDDGGHRWLFRSKRITLDLSLAAGLPVPKGEKAAAREGMPGLDATLELGPRLNLQLWKHARHQFSAVIPLRLTSSVSFSRLAYRGWMFSPFFLYMYEDKSRNGWKFDILAGPLYASKNYHDYYYSVDQAYVNENRSFFEAKQGYSGSRVTVYLQKSYKRLWLSVFARYDVLTNAVFEKSPLVEKNSYVFGGFVIGWMLKKSPKSVYVGG